MWPLERLDRARAARIEALVFDLDDTLLDDGVLGEAALGALHAASRAGLALWGSTGRPAGWAEVFARVLPVGGCLAENGALAFEKTAGRVVCRDPVDAPERARRKGELARIVEAVAQSFPLLVLSDDHPSRRTDATFDVGEHQRVPPDVVARAESLARSLGARTFTSSVHLHLTLDAHDKASGYAALARGRGQDPVAALARAAFVGDSGNDRPAFAAFGLTFGVANVRAHLARLTVPPTFVAERPGGEGFAQVVEALLGART